MKAPREAKNGWERALSRYFHAWNIPLTWNYHSRRFEGLKSLVFVRINPKTQEEPAWPRMPQIVRTYERKTANDIAKPVIILVTNRNYGDSIDDTLVVMRLGTALPMLKTFIESDKERHT